jgi:hypothetical protein
MKSKTNGMIGCRLPECVIKKLDDYCKINKITRSDFIKRIIIKELGGKYIPETIKFN